MNSTNAWIMKIDDTIYVSVAQSDLAHVLVEPDTISIPKTPPYCHQITLWNSHVLPVLDLGCLLRNTGTCSIPNLAGVFAYKDSDNVTQYGAMQLTGSPELEQVTNDQICELPDHLHALKSFSLSCFTSRSGHSVPILDVSKLFSSQTFAQVA